MPAEKKAASERFRRMLRPSQQVRGRHLWILETSEDGNRDRQKIAAAVSILLKKPEIVSDNRQQQRQQVLLSSAT
jgi:hypothetical protein